MDGYYMVGDIVIPYSCFEVIIIGDLPQCISPDFTKTEKEREMGTCKGFFYHVFRFLCKANYKSDKFIHALRIPTTRSCDYLNLLVL